MRNCSDKSYRENQNTHILNSVTFSDFRAAYEIMCQNVVEPDRPQIDMRRMRFECWISMVTDTYSVYLTLIAFPSNGNKNVFQYYV
jgi:hypothetical protein